MEKLLEKLAHKLNTMDESSLSALWEKYIIKVNAFTPTQEWEEATLSLGMIQSLRWKNQLFNFHLKQKTEQPHIPQPAAQTEPAPFSVSAEIKNQKSGKILSFLPHNSDS